MLEAGIEPCWFLRRRVRRVGKGRASAGCSLAASEELEHKEEDEDDVDVEAKRGEDVLFGAQRVALVAHQQLCVVSQELSGQEER